MALRQCLLNEKDQKHFITSEFLRKTVTASTVEECLLSLGIQASDVASVVPQITARAMKLFSVLVLVAAENHIFQFLKEGLSDEIFPVYKAEDLLILDKENCRLDFLREQWTIPPLFTGSKHLELPSECSLPFIDKKRSNHGSFGIIFKVKIADGHLPGYSSHDILALKIVEKPNDLSSDVAMREIETLRKRSHPNIVPLLASFTTTESESGFLTQSLNMLFPYADMDMEKWMTLPRAPDWLKNRSDQRQFLYKSLYDVLSGLAHLHGEIDVMVTSHHDLKPKNIILLGKTFMICDFGMTHLRPLDQGSETQGTSDLGTFTYHPPEYWSNEGIRASRAHGRPFDIWAMGCIMIEIAVLIVYGWESGMLKTFRDQRSRLPDVERRFSNKPQDNSFHNSGPVVCDWLTRLQLNDSPNLRETLRIAIQMLRASPENRIYSWEAKLDMFELLNPDLNRSKVLEIGRKDIQRPSPEKDADGSPTPLHRAAERGNLYRLRILLESGWSPRTRDDNGYTPYELAQRNGHLEICDILSYFTSSLKGGIHYPTKTSIGTGPLSSVIHVREGDGFRLRSLSPADFESRPTKYLQADESAQMQYLHSPDNTLFAIPNVSYGLLQPQPSPRISKKRCRKHDTS